MNGLIALLGSGEYLPVMNEVDAYLLANSGANGRKPRVVCLPTAAGQEGPKSVARWSNMGVEHFTKLGAEVQAVPVTDKATANDLNHAMAVEEADLIYFSGGNLSLIHISSITGTPLTATVSGTPLILTPSITLTPSTTPTPTTTSTATITLTPFQPSTNTLTSTATSTPVSYTHLSPPCGRGTGRMRMAMRVFLHPTACLPCPSHPYPRHLLLEP